MVTKILLALIGYAMVYCLLGVLGVVVTALIDGGLCYYASRN
jgi:hypothetical protein